MVSCTDAQATKALATVAANSPELARKAVLTAFLFKNSKRWTDEDTSLDALQEEEDNHERQRDEDEDYLEPEQEFVDMFDVRKNANGDPH